MLTRTGYARTAYKDQDKDKDLTHKDQDKDKDLNLVLKESLRTRTSLTVTYYLQLTTYLLLKPTIDIKQQQRTQSESSQHMTVKPITLNKQITISTIECVLYAKLRNRTCQGLDRQGQEQGLDLQGQGQGLTTLENGH